MKLIKCRIENFGKLSNFDYDFSEGLNTILQDNGWGKTTFAAFLKVMLYGFSDSENERSKFAPENGGIFGGTLEFLFENKRYQIQRAFDKDKSQDITRVMSLDDNQVVDKFGDNIGEMIFHLNEHAFKKCVYISGRLLLPQGAINGLKERLKVLLEQINDVSGYEKTINNLTKQLNSYENEGKTGLIDELLKEINDKKAALLDMEKEINQLDAMKDRVNTLDSDIQNIAKELISKKEEYEQSLLKQQQNDIAKEEIGKLDESISNLSNNIQSLKDEIGNNIPSDEDINRFKQNSGLLDALTKQLIDVSNSYDEVFVKLSSMLEKYNGQIVDIKTFDEMQHLYDELKNSNAGSVESNEQIDEKTIREVEQICNAVKNDPRFIDKLIDILFEQSEINEYVKNAIKEDKSENNSLVSLRKVSDVEVEKIEQKPEQIEGPTQRFIESSSENKMDSNAIEGNNQRLLESNNTSNNATNDNTDIVAKNSSNNSPNAIEGNNQRLLESNESSIQSKEIEYVSNKNNEQLQSELDDLKKSYMDNGVKKTDLIKKVKVYENELSKLSSMKNDSDRYSPAVVSPVVDAFVGLKERYDELKEREKFCNDDIEKEKDFLLNSGAKDTVKSDVVNDEIEEKLSFNGCQKVLEKIKELEQKKEQVIISKRKLDNESKDLEEYKAKLMEINNNASNELSPMDAPNKPPTVACYVGGGVIAVACIVSAILLDTFFLYFLSLFGIAVAAVSFLNEQKYRKNIVTYEKYKEEYMKQKTYSENAHDIKSQYQKLVTSVGITQKLIDSLDKEIRDTQVFLQKWSNKWNEGNMVTQAEVLSLMEGLSEEDKENSEVNEARTSGEDMSDEDNFSGTYHGSDAPIPKKTVVSFIDAPVDEEGNQVVPPTQGDNQAVNANKDELNTSNVKGNIQKEVKLQSEKLTILNNQLEDIYCELREVERERLGICEIYVEVKDMNFEDAINFLQNNVVSSEKLADIDAQMELISRNIECLREEIDSISKEISRQAELIEQRTKASGTFDNMPQNNSGVNTMPQASGNDNTNTLPQTRSNENTLPEARANENTLPEAKGTENTLPEARANENTLPEAKGTENTLPEARANENTLPEAKGTENTLPEARANENTLPEAKGTENTLPAMREESGLVTSSNNQAARKKQMENNRKLKEKLDEINSVLENISLEMTKENYKDVFIAIRQKINTYEKYSERYNNGDSIFNVSDEEKQKVNSLREKLNNLLAQFKSCYEDKDISERIRLMRDDMTNAIRMNEVVSQSNDKKRQLQQQIDGIKKDIEDFTNIYCPNKQYTKDNMDEFFNKIKEFERLNKEREDVSLKRNEKNNQNIANGGEYKDANVLKEEIGKLENTREAYLVELTKNQENIRRVDELLERYPQNAYDVRHLEERKNKELDKAKTLRNTIACFNKAKTNLSNKFDYTDALNKKLNYYLQRFVNQDVNGQFDEELNICLDDKKGKHSVSYYGSGYNEFCEFCMRLALIDCLFKDEKTFLILDDPFVNLDETNLEKATSLLSEVAKDTQVIYFTSHKSRVRELPTINILYRPDEVKNEYVQQKNSEVKIEVVKQNTENEMLKQNTENEVLKQNTENEVVKQNTENEVFKQNTENEVVKQNTENEVFKQNTENEVFKQNTENEVVKQNTENEVVIENNNEQTHETSNDTNRNPDYIKLV